MEITTKQMNEIIMKIAGNKNAMAELTAIHKYIYGDRTLVVELTDKCTVGSPICDPAKSSTDSLELESMSPGLIEFLEFNGISPYKITTGSRGKTISEFDKKYAKRIKELENTYFAIITLIYGIAAGVDSEIMEYLYENGLTLEQLLGDDFDMIMQNKTKKNEIIMKIAGNKNAMEKLIPLHKDMAGDWTLVVELKDKCTVGFPVDDAVQNKAESLSEMSSGLIELLELSGIFPNKVNTENAGEILFEYDKKYAKRIKELEIAYFATITLINTLLKDPEPEVMAYLYENGLTLRHLLGDDFYDVHASRWSIGGVFRGMRKLIRI